MRREIEALRGIVEDLADRLASLETRTSTMSLDGRVVERDHVKGVRIQLGSDEDGWLSPWTQPGDRTGASRYLPKVGEQYRLIAMNGDITQGILVPLTHTDEKPNPAKDADETVHHSRDGQRHSVKNGHVKDVADKKVTRSAGDPQAASAQGGGMNLPHELNRQLQGLRAQLTQTQHDVTGVFKAVSRLRALTQLRVPEVAALMPFLNELPSGMRLVTAMADGDLERFLGQAFQMSLAKLIDTKLGSILTFTQAAMIGLMNDAISQLAALAQSNGLVEEIGPLIDQLADLTQDAAGGLGPEAITAKLAEVAAVFDGTGAAGPAAGLIGSITAAATQALGMTDFVDAQKNLTSGTTKSYRLGGYGED